MDKRDNSKLQEELFEIEKEALVKQITRLREDLDKVKKERDYIMNMEYPGLAIRTLKDALGAVVKAITAYDYWYPIPKRHSRGRGQAEGIAPCGHTAWTGAPCCQKCADDLILSAVSREESK